MKNIEALEIHEAPGKSRQLLEDIAARRGSVGEMISTMAHSPALLEGFLTLSRSMKRSKLPRTTSEKISLAVQQWIGCGACLQAHGDAARGLGLTESDIDLARRGTSADAREAALIQFALQILAEPSAITPAEVEALRGHGWTDRSIIEVVGVVVLNQMTGSFNLVAGIEPAEDTAAPGPVAR